MNDSEEAEDVVQMHISKSISGVKIHTALTLACEEATNLLLLGSWLAIFAGHAGCRPECTCDDGFLAPLSCWCVQYVVDAVCVSSQFAVIVGVTSLLHARHIHSAEARFGIQDVRTTALHIPYLLEWHCAQIIWLASILT